jgi:hypothetical protein
MLAANGVTCIRLMLEYAQVRNNVVRFIEDPLGRFVPAMVEFWDDLFVLCEQEGVRVLLTPFDTFWTWRHWRHHPYHTRKGGPLEHPSRLLLCAATRAAIKDRLSFAIRRWGGSGALFAWDLWNEIHPAQADGSADQFGEFIHDLSRHVRTLETRLYGRTHPQTVSLFGPELVWRSEMPLAEAIFRHPDLDFASIHIYREGTIDHPADTVAPAMDMGHIVRGALAEITDRRPFLDSEHGPIHTFKDHHRTLPEAFDDEYFRHLQWAHLASGAVGGGMRWPNRHPHLLTPGMRQAQRGLAQFLPLIDWRHFERANVNEEIKTDRAELATFGCADERQALIWLLRSDSIGGDGRLDPNSPPITATIKVPRLAESRFLVSRWDTGAGILLDRFEASGGGAAGLSLRDLPVRTDLALAITSMGPG